MLDCGFANIFYCGQIREYIDFWVKLKEEEYVFKVHSKFLNNKLEAIISVSDLIIEKLDMNYGPHILLKQSILNKS
jgi:hypothetical protein